MKNRVYWRFAIYQLLCVVLLAFGFIGCNKKKDTTSSGVVTIESKPSLRLPFINGDTAYYYVNKQVAFGPRVPNSKSHQKCGDFLIQELEKNGCKVTVQGFTVSTFDNKQQNLRNIIGSINPAATKRIVLASHWDSRPFADQDSENTDKPIDAANDGASGVAILLELARAIANDTLKPQVGIDIIFFDGEDYGQPEHSGYPDKQDTWCLGSQYWSKNKHVAGYQAYYGILLDMVGAKNARFYMEGTSVHYAGEVVKKIWGIADANGYGNFFIASPVSSIVDDHYYVNTIARIPMIDIIEYDGNSFSPSWHTHSDNMEVIDKATLKAVGQTVLNVVYSEQ